MAIPQLKVVHEIYPLTDAFRRDWEALHPEAIGGNVFTRLGWLETGWLAFKSPEEKIRPIRFVDEQENTVAMAIHKETVSHRKWGKVIGWRTVDYNAQRIAPVLARDPAHFAGALIALYQEISGRIDVFDFFKLDPLDGNLEASVDHMIEAGLPVKFSVFNEQPQLRLPSVWEEYYQSHSRIFWKGPRRHRRRLAEAHGEVSFKRLRAINEYQNRPLEDVLNELESVFKKSWQYQTIDDDEAVTPHQMMSFYWDAARSLQPDECLDLCLLYTGEELAAFDLNLIEKNIVYMICSMYNADLKKYSPGRLLLIDELEDGVGRGDRIYEFGGEFLGYKEEWTKHKVPSYHLKIRGRTLTARLRGLLD